MRPDAPIYVIDDDDEVRHALISLVTTEGMSVRPYGSARAFLNDLATLPPGTIISDVRMPELDGLELLAELTARGRTDPVVLITAHADVPLAVRALKLGVRDLLEKPFVADALLEALSAAQRPEEGDRERPPDHAGTLTPRERQVFAALVAGSTNKQIGLRLGISPRTVEVHRAKLMDKMHVDSLSQLIRLGLNAAP